MAENSQIINELWRILQQKQIDEPNSWTATLLKRGKGFVCQKVIEESGEVAVAALSEPKEQVVEESADLIYHLMVLWRICELEPDAVWKCLEERSKKHR